MEKELSKEVESELELWEYGRQGIERMYRGRETHVEKSKTRVIVKSLIKGT